MGVVDGSQALRELHFPNVAIAFFGSQEFHLDDGEVTDLKYVDAFEKSESKPSKTTLATLEEAYTEMRLEEAGVDWELVEVVGRKGGDGKWVPSWGKWVRAWC